MKCTLRWASRNWLWAIPLALLLACEPTRSDRVYPDPGTFDHPQAALFVDGLLLVTNTGYDAQSWRTGSVAVISPERMQVTHRYNTSELNPQRLIKTKDAVYIINTGTFDLSDFANPRSATRGSIDRIARGAINDPNATMKTHRIERDGRFVSPIDAAGGNGELIITSGLKPSVLYLDMTRAEAATSVTELPTMLSTGLGAIRPWRDGFIVVDFNSDKAFLLNDSAELQCQIDVGEISQEMEGAMAPVIHQDDLYLVLALSGVVRRVSLSGTDPCANPVNTLVSPLGQVPNDLKIVDDQLWVVHSADNNLIAYDLNTGSEIKRYVLPIGSNPWEAAFSDNGRWIAVTEWAGHAVTLIERATGQMTRIAPSE